MSTLLLNSSDQDKLLKNGWVAFPFLDQTDCETLKRFYSEHTSNVNHKGFHASMFHKDLAYKQQVNSIIQQVVQQKFQTFFSDKYRQLYANFMVKEKGEESKMKWHQDWSYVNEMHHNSYAIWIPLQDLNDTNGALTIAEGSHQLNNYVRGPGIEDRFISENWVQQNYKVKPMYLKQGEAIIWHHRLLHASPPNLSQDARIAATVILIPNDAENIYFYKQRNRKYIVEYKVRDKFYLENKISKAPQEHINKNFFYEFDILSNQQKFEKYVIKNRLKRLFNFS